MRSGFLIAIAFLGLLCGCGKSNAPAGGQTATVTLKDGSTVTGAVTKSDTSSITLQSPNGVVTTYPMTQVSSITYGTSAAPATPPSAAAQNPVPEQSAPSTASAPAAASAPATAPEPAAPKPEPQQTAPPAAYAPPPRPAPPAREYHPAATFREIPAGSTLVVRTNETISSQAAEPGQTYSGVVVEPLTDREGRVAIPRGATATLVVRNANPQGKVQGRSDLVVDVGSVSIGGHSYRLETTDFVERGKEGLGANKRTAEFTGGGGLFGTIVGAIAGGGKGAAIGALSGAAAGAATQTLTRGKPAVIPSESVLRFRLEAPIRIREMR